MRLKFLTLNIWKGNLINKVVSFLKQERPDICVLQEVYNGNEPALRKKFHSYSRIVRELQFPHAVFAPAFLDTTPSEAVENGNAIFSVFPILEHETIFYDVTYGTYVDIPSRYEYCPRNLQHTVIGVDGQQLDVFNTHGIYGIDGKDNERRLAMSKAIVAAVQGKQKAILAGDFNLPADTQTIRNIDKHLRSVFRDRLTTTFNMKRKRNPNYSKVAVDMIFVSKALKLLKRYCPPVDVSDHLPLVCLLEV